MINDQNMFNSKSDNQNFFSQDKTIQDPGEGLFALKTGTFCVYFRGKGIERLREDDMSARQHAYGMRCGEQKIFDCPTEESLTRREMSLSFFVQHQRIKPSHVSQWHEGPKEQFTYLRPIRELKKGEEVSYDYNMDAVI